MHSAAAAAALGVWGVTAAARAESSTRWWVQVAGWWHWLSTAQ